MSHPDPIRGGASCPSWWKCSRQTSGMASVVEGRPLQGYALQGAAYIWCNVAWASCLLQDNSDSPIQPQSSQGVSAEIIEPVTLLAFSFHPLLFLSFPSMSVDPRFVLKKYPHSTFCLGVSFLKHPNGNSHDTWKCLALPVTWAVSLMPSSLLSLMNSSKPWRCFGKISSWLFFSCDVWVLNSVSQALRISWIEKWSRSRVNLSWFFFLPLFSPSGDRYQCWPAHTCGSLKPLM